MDWNSNFRKVFCPRLKCSSRCWPRVTRSRWVRQSLTKVDHRQDPYDRDAPLNDATQLRSPKWSCTITWNQPNSWHDPSYSFGTPYTQTTYENQIYSTFWTQWNCYNTNSLSRWPNICENYKKLTQRPNMLKTSSRSLKNQPRPHLILKSSLQSNGTLKILIRASKPWMLMKVNTKPNLSHFTT